MKVSIWRFLPGLILIILLSCASTRSTMDRSGAGQTTPGSDLQISAIQGNAFGAAQEFLSSPYKEVGLSGLFDVHSAGSCRIAVLPNGDDSFAARIQALKRADTSVRIQALILTGDESGIYITELLKEKRTYRHDSGKVKTKQDDHLIDAMHKGVMMLREAEPPNSGGYRLPFKLPEFDFFG